MSTGKVKCKLCSGDFIKQSGTTNLLNHLKGVHPKQYSEVTARSGPSAKGELADDSKTTRSGTKPLNTQTNWKEL